MKNLLRAVIARIRQIFHFIFGQFNGAPPSWLRAIGVLGARTKGQGGKHLGRSSLMLAGVLGLAIAGYAGWRWYQAQPKPVEYDVKVDSIDRTCIARAASAIAAQVSAVGSTGTTLANAAARPLNVAIKP